MPLSPLLANYDHVVLDLDGCVWLGEQPTRGAAEAVAALREAGKSITFVTNDSRRSPEEYVRKLWSLGLKASLEEVVTAGSAIQHVLAERGRGHGRGTYVIGSPAIFRHVSEAGQRIVNGTEHAAEADLVVIAGHDDLHFAELRAATQAVLGGAEMIAADRDRTFPTDDGIWPGTGAIVAALEYATNKTARNVGKPDPQLFDTALDRMGPGATLAVGDSITADLEGAANAGLDGAIVLTGITTREQAETTENPEPVAIAEDLHALVTGS